MFFKVILLFIYFVVLIETAYEGERCVKDGVSGVCTNINRCKSAIQDIRSKKNPQICSFVKTEPIVCCLDGRTGTFQSTGTTTRRPSVTPVKHFPSFVRPQSYDEENICEELPLSVTARKTGQKAFDKCIEYQEKYVYPCEQGASLLGEWSRNYHCHHTVDELIIGGVSAARYEFPHMVMLAYGSLDQLIWLCGGALISERYILTAGHCLTSKDLGPATYVLVGALKRSESTDRSKVYKVKNTILHPGYKPPSKYNDIALIETEKPVNLDQYTVPACVHTGDAVDDEKVLATGWGLNDNGNPAEILQKVILEKFSTNECSQKFKPVPVLNRGFDGESQTCYGDQLIVKDTSFGDSGGPLQIKSKTLQCMYTIVGVTSFGSEKKGKPAVYTRVSNYVNWIESIVWPN